MHLSRNQFGTWLGRYVEAWRSGDPAAIGELFSADCSYSFRGGHTTVVGRENIVKAWLGEAEPGSWDASYEPLAIEDEVHVSIGWTRYADEAGAPRDEFSNIFVCRFDDAGQCTRFSEWWMRAPGPVGRLD
jgi:ketosteroid isomerase-like protein